MADVHDKATRSRNMSAIRGKDTRPERIIRKAIFARGFRYRLHDKRLPGKPDLVFPKYHAVIFVHGCFWHGHDCSLFKWPESRRTFWKKKISRNMERDEEVYGRLDNLGWYILTIWECALKGAGKRSLNKVIDDTERWLIYGTRNMTVRGKGR